MNLKILSLILLSVIPNTASGLTIDTPLNFYPLPQWTGQNCEEVAKAAYKYFGGELVFILPLKASGALDLGKYKGHWLNYRDGYYRDYSLGIATTTKEEYIKEYSRKTGHANYEMWNIKKESPPFQLIEHYPTP